MTRRVPSPSLVGRSKWDLPDAADADEYGVVGFGADLAVETLVDAYRRGLFPWPHEGVPLPWFSPDPRAVVDVVHSGATLSRSLRQRLRRCGWVTTVDADFAAVVDACASRPASDGTWVTAEMRDAYRRLHQLGWAHSLEVWSGGGGGGGELVGGLYGVTVGGCFTGESMFHREPDASKVAFVDLLDRWRDAGGALVDVQIPTAHLMSLGAIELARSQFLDHLARVRDDDVRITVDPLVVSRLAPAPAAPTGS